MHSAVFSRSQRLLGGCLLLGYICGSAYAQAQPEQNENDAPAETQRETPAEEPREDSDVDNDAEGGTNTSPAPTTAGAVPPQVTYSEQPTYPQSELSSGAHPTVVLQVIVGSDGQVTETRIEHSGGEAFDEAALEALQRWRFRPAQRDGTAIAARIRLAIHFEVPEIGTPPNSTLVGTPDSENNTPDDTQAGDPDLTDEEGGSESTTADEARDNDEDPEFGAAADVEATEARAAERGASSFTIDSDVIMAAPRAEGAEILRSIPGVYLGRPEGDGLAHRIILRGFDADHGQDIELSAGGIPINMPSHIHGQGYADLGFLIPEVVQQLNVTEGVYDPRQGDFAVAGSIGAQFGVTERGWQLRSSYGAFNTFRQLLLWAPENERRATFGAVQYRHSDGFGIQRSSDTISTIAQIEGRRDNWRFRGLGIFYGARADTAGVVRQDDIDSGRVDYYETYDTPSARSQNALAGRILLGGFADYRGEAGDNGSAGVWLSLDHFRVQQNLTGFIQRSRELARVSGRGDLIEQRNQTLSLGLQARYRTEAWSPWDILQAHLEVGLDGRFDTINQAQNLLDAAVRNQTWDRRVDTSIFAGQGAFWGDVDLKITEYVRLRGGLRGVLLFYEVDDRLGNFVPLTRPDDAFIIGYRRSAAGLSLNPRTSLEVNPTDWLSIRAAYGQGYRSPQARTLSEGERTPFTLVQSADAGIHAHWDDFLKVQLAGYWTELSDDVAFDPREGRLERLGESRRLGAVAYIETRPVDWLIGALSVTYVRAELLEPPPPTADNPQPPFRPGEALPYVPPILVRADVGGHWTLMESMLGEELRARVGLGYSFVSARPLPYGAFADPFSLFDASAAIQWGPVELGMNVFNLLDSRYAGIAYNYASNWNPGNIRSRVPAQHIAAGAPLTWMITLGVQP